MILEHTNTEHLCWFWPYIWFCSSLKGLIETVFIPLFKESSFKHFNLFRYFRWTRLIDANVFSPLCEKIWLNIICYDKSNFNSSPNKKKCSTSTFLLINMWHWFRLGTAHVIWLVWVFMTLPHTNYIHKHMQTHACAVHSTEERIRL